MNYAQYFVLYFSVVRKSLACVALSSSVAFTNCDGNGILKFYYNIFSLRRFIIYPCCMCNWQLQMVASFILRTLFFCSSLVTTSVAAGRGRRGHAPRAALCRGRHFLGRKYGILQFSRFWRIGVCIADSDILTTPNIPTVLVPHWHSPYLSVLHDST